MNNQPLISVIVPVYNGENFVEKCLKNLLTQTYRNLEILVIDDGSNDNSAKIAKKFPVKVTELQNNYGLSAARNAGIKIAGGEYIHFMDIDDEINSEFYERLMESITKTKSDIAVASMINEEKPHRSIIYEEQYLMKTNEDKLKITNVGRRGYVWRYLFNSLFLKKYHLNFEEGRLIEDLPFSLAAVYYAEQVVTAPEAKYFYKSNEGSIMKNKNKMHRKKRHADRMHIKEFRQKFAKKHKIKIPGVPTGRLGYYFVKWFT